MFSHFFNRMWYQPERRMAWLFFPIACGYAFFSMLRRFGLKRVQWQPPVKVIVVGNITLGGVGKTPLVIALAKQCMQQGYRVGIVSRGYRAGCKRFPHRVISSDTSEWVGDEPLLIARSLQCPVVIAPRRVDAVNYLISQDAVDLIISDDGLQHYALGRSLEIAVIDGSRGFGNGMIFPAGPLRESIQRLRQVDFCVVNVGKLSNGAALMTEETFPHCFCMHYQVVGLIHLKTGVSVSIEVLKAYSSVTAIAGIGSPERFFATLASLGVNFHPKVFADHYSYQEKEFNAILGPVIMTEKDAVKCEKFAKEDWYSLRIEANLDPIFWEQINGALLDRV